MKHILILLSLFLFNSSFIDGAAMPIPLQKKSCALLLRQDNQTPSLADAENAHQALELLEKDKESAAKKIKEQGIRCLCNAMEHDRNPDLIPFLVERGVEVNDLHQGTTALMLLISSECSRNTFSSLLKTQMLIDWGAALDVRWNDPNHPNHNLTFPQLLKREVDKIPPANKEYIYYKNLRTCVIDACEKRGEKVIKQLKVFFIPDISAIISAYADSSPNYGALELEKSFPEHSPIPRNSHMSFSPPPYPAGVLSPISSPPPSHFPHY